MQPIKVDFTRVVVSRSLEKCDIDSTVGRVYTMFAIKQNVPISYHA